MGRKERTLIIGCGQKGLDWAAQQTDHVFCLDQAKILPSTTEYQHPTLVTGDAFSLPLRSDSVTTIHADFLLNNINARNISFSDTKEQPTLLEKPPFPPLVRDWYEGKRGSIGYSDADTIRRLLRTTALRQIWRILAPIGKVTIIDKREVIDWIRVNATSILQTRQEDLIISASPIVSSDHNRSAAKTLKVLDQYPDGAKKIIIEKKC